MRIIFVSFIISILLIIFIMASRLTLYQKSIKKFIINQSILSKYDKKDDYIDLMDGDDFILPVTTLTVMNGQLKKNSINSSHGYDTAIGIELLYTLIKILENDKKIINDDKYTLGFSSKFSIIPNIIIFINQSLLRNIDFVEKCDTETNTKISKKTYSICLEYVSDKTQKIIDAITSINCKNIEMKTKYLSKSEFKHYHFNDEKIQKELPDIKQIPRNILNKYIDDVYCTISKVSLVLGWIIGCSSHGMIDNLERVGQHLGYMIKISNDFCNIENDIINCKNNDFTFNFVLNYGLQTAFDIFDECKKKFIEGLMVLHISSNTINEFIDVLETKVNKILEKSSPDIKLTSSSNI